MTGKKLSQQHQAAFDVMRQVDQNSNEFWSARDLAPVLGYQDWRNFMQVVDKARVACAQSGRRPEDHFGEITKMVAIGSGAQRPAEWRANCTEQRADCAGQRADCAGQRADCTGQRADCHPPLRGC